jgi:hypothetical protein
MRIALDRKATASNLARHTRSPMRAMPPAPLRRRTERRARLVNRIADW